MLRLLLILCLLTTHAYAEDFSDTYYMRLYELSRVEVAENVIIGDSLASKHEFKNLVNYGIPGDTVDGVRNRLKMVRAIYPHPKNIFILVGTNDIDNYNTLLLFNQFVNYVYIPLKRMESDVIIVTIPYVAKDYPGAKVKNKKIAIFNRLLRRKFFVLDLNKATEKDGYLNPDYSLDGIHLNEKGYAIFEGMVDELLKSPEA